MSVVTPKKGIVGTGMTLDAVVCLVLLGFGIALSVVAVANAGIWLLLLVLGLPLIGMGAAGVVLAWKHRI